MMPSDQDVPLLSVVVIGLNEGPRIANCIDSIHRAIEGVGSVSIVFIDSGSKDDTVSIALSKGVRVFQLGRTQPPSPAAGRFVGSLVTQSKYILFVDGDSILARGWVKPALERMEADPRLVMVAGRIYHDPGFPWETLAEVKDLGPLRETFSIGGGRAPIVARSALEAAGNWNPFLRAEEERDFAIRLRFHVVGAKLMESDQFTAWSPVYPPTPGEYWRRWKRGLLKGRGQVLRNALADGYWKECWYVFKSSLLFMTFVVGLAISIPLHLWWQFLALFLGVAIIRAMITRKITRSFSVVYSLILGFLALWEFLTVPVRTAVNYTHDYVEINPGTLSGKN